MLNPISLSIKISFIATFIVFIISIFAVKFIGRSKSRFKNIIETLIVLPLVLPPSVVGYILLTIFSRNSFIGQIIYKLFKTQIIFTTWAGVIAAVVVSLPLMYQSLKSAVLTIDISYIEAARTMGASELYIFFKIILPLSITGIVSGFVLTFSRCLGEFGATLMVMGNIPGKTQTIPTAIYFAVETGDTHLANTLVIFITILSFSLNFFLNFYLKRKANH